MISEYLFIVKLVQHGICSNLCNRVIKCLEWNINTQSEEGNRQREEGEWGGREGRKEEGWKVQERRGEERIIRILSWGWPKV